MNKKIMILIAAALIGCCNLVYGQKKKKRPVKVDTSKVETLQETTTENEKSTRAFVELKDGSTLLGNITSDNQEVLEITVIGDNDLRLKHGYIKSILKEGENISLTKRGRYNYNKGVFCNIMPLGVGVKVGIGGTFTSQFVLGYQLNERLGLGAGFGFEYFQGQISDTWFDFWTYPAYAYAKYNINLNGPRVYALGKLGYANRINSAWNRHIINTNLYTALGIGVAFPTKWIGRFVMELSNSMILTNGTLIPWNNNGGIISQDFTSFMRRSTLKIGFALGQ